MEKSYSKNLNTSSLNSVEQAKEQAVINALEGYKSLIKTKENLTYVFSGVDKSGNLFLYEDGIKIQLSNSDILASGKGTNLYYRSRLIGRAYNVVVKSVDMDKRIVYVSAKGAYATMRQELLKDIEAACRMRQPMVMAAKIIAYQNDKGYAVLDLYGCGVLAIVSKKEWNRGYLTNFGEDGINVGDVIYVKLKYATRRLKEYNNKLAYVTSRAEVLENPYDGLAEKYPVGSIVVIKPVQLMRHNFFAKIDGLNGIDVYCSYPGDKYFGDNTKNLRITLGHYYAAYVYEVNEEEQRFRCKVFTQTNVDGKKCVQDITQEQIRRSVAMSLVAPDELDGVEEVPADIERVPVADAPDNV